MEEKTIHRPKTPQPKYVKSLAILELERLALKRLKDKYPNVPYIVAPKYVDTSANTLTRCVIHYIEFRGFFAERVNTMGRQIDNRISSKDVLGNTRTIGSIKWIKTSGKVGSSDIHAVIQGRSVMIEIKAGNDRYQSEGQKAYQKQIEASGGTYIIVRTFQGFYDWFNPNKAKTLL